MRRLFRAYALTSFSGLHNAFGNLSETAVILEQEVEHAKKSIGKSQNEYRNLIEEIEAKIRLEYETRFLELESKLPNCTKQIAFRKRAKFECKIRNHDQCKPIRDKAIFQYDIVEYTIGVDSSKSGMISLPVSGHSRHLHSP